MNLLEGDNWPLVLQWCRIDPLGPGLCSPSKDGDVGWDLAAGQEVIIPPSEKVDVPTNIRVQLPPHCWAEMRARSSIAKMGLQVEATVIDNGYTGPIFVLLRNMTRNTVELKRWQRFSQIVLHHGVWVRGEEVDDIPDDPRRGNAGFGSTDLGTFVNDRF